MKRILLLLALLLLTGCRGKNNSVEYTFMTAEECANELVSDESYYSDFGQIGLDFLCQKKDATVEEYKAFTMEQALEFSDAEKDVIDQSFEIINQKMEEAGLQYPIDCSISIGLTTMHEAEGAAGYTKGTNIYLCADFVDYYIGEQLSADDEIVETVAHEVFHVLTRNDPEFRKNMYSIIGFTVNDSDFEMPDYVREICIPNPDVEHHDSYATFTIDGVKRECYLVFLTEDVFENPGDNFFYGMYTGLVDIHDGTLYRESDASDFYDVVGRNTFYCEDPEECMATNFSYAVLYGMDGANGEGYESPEIIEDIINYMKK